MTEIHADSTLLQFIIKVYKNVTTSFATFFISFLLRALTNLTEGKSIFFLN